MSIAFFVVVPAISFFYFVIFAVVRADINLAFGSSIRNTAILVLISMPTNIIMAVILVLAAVLLFLRPSLTLFIPLFIAAFCKIAVTVYGEKIEKHMLPQESDN